MVWIEIRLIYFLDGAVVIVWIVLKMSDEGFQFTQRLVCRRACIEPPAEQRELRGGWLRFAIGRHVIVVVHRKAEAFAEQTLCGICGIEARTRVATFEQEFNSVHAEAALGFI